MTSYNVLNPNSDPISRSDIDTGVATAPGSRAETFHPPGTTMTVPAPTVPGTDTGSGSQAASRANVKDRLSSTSVTIDLGLTVSG